MSHEITDFPERFSTYGRLFWDRGVLAGAKAEKEAVLELLQRWINPPANQYDVVRNQFAAELDKLIKERQ